jgi:Toprim-like
MQETPPNPFVNPNGFKSARKSVSPNPGNYGQDAPNPFVYPRPYRELRELTRQISKPQNHINQPTPISQLPDPLTSHESLNPLNEKETVVDMEKAGNPFFNAAHYKLVRESIALDWAALNAAIDDLAISEVIAELGGIGNQDGDPTKYKVRGENVIINGQLWHSKNSDEGGGGAVSLVCYFEDIQRRDDAKKWIANKFKSRLGTDALKHSLRANATREKPVFEAPESASEYIDDIRDYLHKERGISTSLIDRLVSEGRVYSDPRRNVVMISKQGQLAELRGIEAYKDRNGDWKTTKMLKPGSDKSSGAFMVTVDRDKVKDGSIVHEKTIAVVEAGIDAMSYHMLFPGRDVFSASGASFNFPRKTFFEAYQNGYRFHCGFDSDLAGDKASQNIYNSASLFYYLKTTEPFSNAVKTPSDFLSLLNKKIIRLKLKPALQDHEKDSNQEHDDDDMEAGISQNVLFFNSQNPFSDPANPPKIFYSVAANSIGIPTGKRELVISPELHANVLNEFKIQRDRPENAKDWNELVKPKPKNMPKFTN